MGGQEALARPDWGRAVFFRIRGVVMFGNVRRDNPGRSVLLVLAVVISAWLVVAGALVRAYAAGLLGQ